jgi:hypothetical protein
MPIKIKNCFSLIFNISIQLGKWFGFFNPCEFSAKLENLALEQRV